MIVNMRERCGSFAENKDEAKQIREDIIKPCIDGGNEVVILDFAGVDSSTQSFIHALISGFFQKHGEAALDNFEFRSCSKAVKSLLATVINYSLE